ncbi:MAG TPA: MFS transporter [Candidatus Gastranaerophilales bacterium]|nr:MFS transporter [Candidatus Gastranaerophilales bacterium]
MQNILKLNDKTWQKLMLLITSTLVIMADLTVSPILPKIQEFFGNISNINFLVKMVLTMPALFIVISSPFIGYLLDKYGRKRIILASICVYIIAGTSGFFANSIYELLTGRAFLGIATAGIITGCSALVGDYYKGEEIAKMMGLQSTFIGFSGLIFLFLGGLLGDIHWRATFLVYLLPVILIFLFSKYIKEPVNKKKFQQNVNPLDINNNIFIKKLVSIYLIAFGLMIFFYMAPLQIPFYLKSITSINNAQVGLTIAIMPLFSAITAIFYKNIKKYFSFRSVFLISFFIMGIGYLTISSSPQYIFSAIGLGFAGAAMGMIIPNLRAWIGSCSDSAFLGRAFGGLTASIYLGQFFSPIFAGYMIQFIGIAAGFAVAGSFLLLISLGFVLFQIKSI